MTSPSPSPTPSSPPAPLATPPLAPPPGLRPQFRLTTLLLLMTLVCLLFAAFRLLGPIGAFAMVLAIMTILAHVSGNAIGSFLRDNARPGAQPREDLCSSPAPHQVLPTEPVSKLGEMGPLGRPIYIITAMSGLFSGMAGICFMIFLSSKPVPAASMVAGSLVLAALGAFWTFVTGSFLQVAFGAFLHALRGSRNRPPKS